MSFSVTSVRSVVSLNVLEVAFENERVGGVCHQNCAHFGKIVAIYGEIPGNHSKVAKLEIGHLRRIVGVYT